MLSPRLLSKLADDQSLPEATREALRRTAAADGRLASAISPTTVGQARIRLFDCAGDEILPGASVDLSTTADQIALRVAETTRRLLDFYRTVLGRNSIDDRGCDVDSSIHYSRGFCNAYWSRGRMVYGDGDGYLFNNFASSEDFIGHELTHGVTEASTHMGYEDEYGALNESLSDVLGVTFKHWLRGWTVDQADWRVGSELIAPAGGGQGWTCIRDLSHPGAAHALNRQPQHYDHYQHGGDPHENSGIANYAYYLAAKQVGGQTWIGVGKIWYATLTLGGLGSKPTFRRFARETVRQAKRLFGATDIPQKVASAWRDVGITP